MSLVCMSPNKWESEEAKWLMSHCCGFQVSTFRIAINMAQNIFQRVLPKTLCVIESRHCKTGQNFLTRPIWPAIRLTRLKMTRFDLQPDWPDPTYPFYCVYQHWVNWDWGVILIKYLLIFLYLICYVLHYSLSFFTCHLQFFFLF